MRSRRSPAARARHQKRHPQGGGPVGPNGGGNPFDPQQPPPAGETQSLSTVVQSIPLPGTTLVNTQIITVEVPIQTSASSASVPSVSSQTPSSASSAASSNSASSSIPTISLTSSGTASDTSSSSSSSGSSSSTSPSSLSSSPTSSSPSNIPSSLSTDPFAIPSGVAASSSVFAAPSTSATSSQDSVGASTQNNGLSVGAIIGIIAGSAAVLIVIAIFFVRKRFLRRRERRRVSWTAGLYEPPTHDILEKIDDVPPRTPDKDRSNQVTTSQQSDMSTAAMQRSLSQTRPQPPAPATRMAPAANPFVSLPPLPPMAYNNPAPYTSAPSSTYQPLMAAQPAPAPAGGPAKFALVRSMFIPALPDELSISPGERVRVLTEYDDGWAFCSNARNEQGMVPTECLELDQGAVRQRYPTQQPAYLGQGTGDWRMSQRASSLFANPNIAAGRI